MKDDAKSTNQDKHSMLMDLKLKASRRTYTMAMSTKPQRAKMTKTVPKDTKTRLEHALEGRQNMLQRQVQNKMHARPRRANALRLLQPNMACFRQIKSEL